MADRTGNRGTSDRATDLDYAGRVADLQDRLVDRDLDAAVCFQRGTARYLTGWRQNTSSVSVVVVTPDSVRYFVPVLDEAAAKAECWVDDDAIGVFPDEGDPVDAVVESLDSTVERVGVEQATIPARRRDAIEDALAADIQPVDELLSEARSVKTDAERALYREAAAVTSGVMRTVLDEVEPGTRECDVTARARALFVERGGEGPSFEPFAMAGEHAAMPHRTATERTIDDGELVVFDMGLVWEGYATDVTRTFLFGEPTAEQQRLFEAARAAQQAAIDAVEPGVPAEAVHQRAVDVLARYDLDDYFPHLTGHGLGYDIHEAPLIDAGHADPLEAGMVVTIEPGVYKPGVGAARIEDMVLVTEDGHEVLTDVPRDLVTEPVRGRTSLSGGHP